jgi:hypothetical protein
MVLTDYYLMACNAVTSGTKKPMFSTKPMVPVLRGEKMVQITLKY